MSILFWRAGLPGLAILLVPLGEAVAHEIVGNRFFPATLGIDDPGVNDELAFPTVDSFKTGDDPSVRQRDISGEFSKRITDAFAVSFSPTYTHLSPPGGLTGMGASGFQNLETTFKYRVFRNPEHEFVMSVGLSVEWGGTGSKSVGADPFNTYTPTFYFGKGLGDLPDTLSWIRPVAITGQIGYAWDRALFYVKGGAAVTDNKYTANSTLPPLVGIDTASETRWGAAVGVGFEYAFAYNWSLGFEYDHLFMGNNDVVSSTGFLIADHIKEDVDLFTARLNYKFGGPVVARY